MSTLRQSLARDERGATIVEMGFAAPMLAALLIGMVDLSQGFSSKLQLEQAAQRTLESVQQRGYNYTDASTNDNAALKTEAQTAAGAGSVATVTSYVECWNGGSKTRMTFDGTCPSGQTQSRYVSISIRQNYAPRFGFRFLGATAGGTYAITGKAALRTQ